MKKIYYIPIAVFILIFIIFFNIYSSTVETLTIIPVSEDSTVSAEGGDISVPIATLKKKLVIQKESWMTDFEKYEAEVEVLKTGVNGEEFGKQINQIIESPDAAFKKIEAEISLYNKDVVNAATIRSGLQERIASTSDLEVKSRLSRALKLVDEQAIIINVIVSLYQNVSIHIRQNDYNKTLRAYKDIILIESLIRQEYKWIEQLSR